MRIVNNISAMNTHRQLTVADSSLSKSLERLSSGLRINRAGDDAAGLAISEKMRAQIRGMKQAIRNAQDGISVIQTAEGALTEVHNMLNRMRELTVQAGNSTLTDGDKDKLHAEFELLSAEITRIAETTEFNTMILLTGEFGPNATSGPGKIVLRLAPMPGRRWISPSMTCGPRSWELSQPIQQAAPGSSSAAALMSRILRMH